MSEWRQRPIRELCSHIIDCVNKTAPTVGGPTPWRMIRTTNVRDGRIDLGQTRYVEEDVYKKWVRRGTPRNGDIILTREAPLGEVGRLRDDAGVFLGQRLVLYRPDEDEVDGAFLLGAMRAPGVQNQIRAFGSGSTVEHMRVPDCGELLVDCPPLSEQRKIGALLSAIEELIEINERRIELLEDLARSLYREWFVSSRFPGHEAEGYGAALLPEAWERCRLRDVVTTQYGVTASASERPEGPRLLRGKDINKASFIRWDQVPSCEIADRDTEKYRLEVGDVCVIRMADPGKVGIVERDVEAVFGSYLVRVRSIDSRLPPYLLFHYLDSQKYQDWVSGSSTGSTRKSASAAVLTEPTICLPPLEIAMQFERIASTLRGHLSALVEKSTNLAHIRDLLLPRLVTGQLDISDVDFGVLTPADPE